MADDCLVYTAVAERETCKDDFRCPDGYLNRGDKECRGKCDQEECCERGEYLEDLSRVQRLDVVD